MQADKAGKRPFKCVCVYIYVYIYIYTPKLKIDYFQKTEAPQLKGMHHESLI